MSAATSKLNRLIVDTDAGVDDAIALMLALADRGVEVVAITTVAGNVDVDLVTRNVGVTVERMGAAVPIYQGCAGPLFGPRVHAAGVHGQDGLGDTNFPPSLCTPQPEHAALAMVRLARQYPGELTLVALGPLTNVALALKLDPTFVRNLKSAMVMGGAIHSKGNTSPVAEFNFFADPEAAKLVFNAGIDNLSLLPWETALEVSVPWNDLERLCALNTVRARFFNLITARLQELLRKRIGVCGLLIPDPLAIIAVLCPDAILEQTSSFVDVETDGEIGRGLSAVDYRGLTGKAANALIVHNMHTPQVITALEAMLSK